MESVLASRLAGIAILVASAWTLAGCLPTVTTLAIDAAYTASEERSLDDVVDDNVIKIELNKLLIEEGLGMFKDVSTVVYQGRVLLIGDVEEAADKVRAGEIGGQPEGVLEVLNEIQVTDEGGFLSVVDDIYIEKVIQADYLFDTDIDSANFRVRSVNGVVYLIGLAESQAELDKALAIVGARDDVNRIVNYMRVKPPES